MKSLAAACVYLFLAVLSCFGQSTLPFFTSHAGPGNNPGEFIATYTVSLPPFAYTILPGRPYSGEEVSQKATILSDGTRILEPGSHTLKYRDSAGRVRTERQPQARPAGFIRWFPAPVVPEIVDPVAGYVYFLDQANRIAYRMLLPPKSMRVLSAPPNQNYPASKTVEKEVTRTSEPIGTKMIEGIPVQGRRNITTYAAGTQGNDRPITTTMEIWTSPELGFTVYSQNSDPRTGEFINAVINISRAEPDPALFRIPPGYKTVDEHQVPFTFTIALTDQAEHP